MDRCSSCGGRVAIIYFKDKDGKNKPDYGMCSDCLKVYTVGD